MSVSIAGYDGFSFITLADDKGVIIEPWIFKRRDEDSYFCGVDFGVELMGQTHKLASIHFESISQLERWCYENDVPMCDIPAGAISLKVVK